MGREGSGDGAKPRSKIRKVWSRSNAKHRDGLHFKTAGGVWVSMPSPSCEHPCIVFICVCVFILDVSVMRVVYLCGQESLGHCANGQSTCRYPPFLLSGTRERIRMEERASSRIQSSSSTQIDMLPSVYNRLVARRTGESFRQVAEITQVELQAPGEGEVVVRVEYAGVNGGCETFRCRGEYAFEGNRRAESFNLGAEGCGVVVAVGPPSAAGGHQLSPGDNVMFIGGAFSEYVTVKSSMCFEVNECTASVAALRISGHVAHAALHYVGNMQPGDTVLVTAGGGATGSFAVQYAKKKGCHVVATCGTDAKEELLRDEYGVDRVIHHRKEVGFLQLIFQSNVH